ncbi:MAG: FKBP-type peptidyl-prolyl cis-trans isomerase [Bacteroidia bacterium]|nr:FKBP-type peptidyl-prolyl cis-trans isomerase [Bacteroidia bacterium]MDW8334716.1 FKBP-type peptidyl-prolyl cis-trans isomerase [Bacteroidia bacterium]
MKKTIWATMGAAWILAGCTGGENAKAPTAQQSEPAPQAPAPAFNRFPYGPDSTLIAVDSTKLRTTASGLRYLIVEEGRGNVPKAGQKVIAQYHGILTDGKKFDSSYERGQPFEFTLGQGQVIRGWDEAFSMFKVGTKAVIVVPPGLGYGDRNMGNIPPNSTLIFYVELLGAI